MQPDQDERAPERVGPDLRRSGDGWEPADVLADVPDGGDIAEYLKAQGWEQFLVVGEPDGALCLRTWRRLRPDRRWEFLLEVEDVSNCSPYLLLDSFPDLMDLLARWAPAVQASSISYLMEELGGSLSDDGWVEQVAARVAHGAEVTLPRLRREATERRVAAARRRSEAGQPG